VGIHERSGRCTVEDMAAANRGHVVAVALACLTCTARSWASESTLSSSDSSDDAATSFHFELAFQRWALPLEDSRFSGHGEYSGRDLGFVRPTANTFDLRATLFPGGSVGGVFEYGAGWVPTDGARTDSVANAFQGTGFVSWVGGGVEWVVRLGSVLCLRASSTIGAQVVFVLPRGPSRGGPGVVQMFARPRAALEVPLDDLVSVGIFAIDDVVRPTSWGGGVYVGVAAR